MVSRCRRQGPPGGFEWSGGQGLSKCAGQYFRVCTLGCVFRKLQTLSVPRRPGNTFLGGERDRGPTLTYRPTQCQAAAGPETGGLLSIPSITGAPFQPPAPHVRGIRTPPLPPTPAKFFTLRQKGNRMGRMSRNTRSAPSHAMARCPSEHASEARRPKMRPTQSNESKTVFLFACFEAILQGSWVPRVPEDALENDKHGNMGKWGEMGGKWGKWGKWDHHKITREKI